MVEQSPVNEPVRAPAPMRVWGWWDAAGIQLLIVALAWALQQVLLMRGVTPTVPPPPWNWLIIGGGLAAAIALGAACRRQRWLLWISGVPFAVSILGVIVAIALLGTLIPQDAEMRTEAAQMGQPDQIDILMRLGLRTLYTSLPFVAAVLLLLLNLGTVIGRRLLTPRPGYIAFLLSHLGMALVLVGMLATPAQFANPKIEIREGDKVSTVSVKDDPNYPLGATVGLTHFEVEKYPPVLAAQEMRDNGRLVTDTEWVTQGRQFDALGLHVSVLQFLPIAMPDEKGGWTAMPAARVAVTGPDGLTAEGWIAPGFSSLGIPPQPLAIGDKYLVGFLEQQPKAYRSELTITEPGQAERTATLEVNHPVRVGDWELYQVDYRVDMGGRLSIIQAVHDPALPVVYCGLLCMVLGAFLALWSGVRSRKSGVSSEESGTKGSGVESQESEEA